VAVASATSSGADALADAVADGREEASGSGDSACLVQQIRGLGLADSGASLVRGTEGSSEGCSEVREVVREGRDEEKEGGDGVAARGRAGEGGDECEEADMENATHKEELRNGAKEESGGSKESAHAEGARSMRREQGWSKESEHAVNNTKEDEQHEALHVKVQQEHKVEQLAEALRAANREVSCLDCG
jgi:hypothetical protein